MIYKQAFSMKVSEKRPFCKVEAITIG